MGSGKTQGLNVKIRWTRGGGRMGSGKTQGLNVKIRWTRGGGGERENGKWKNTRSECQNKVDQGGGGGREWEVEKHKV